MLRLFLATSVCLGLGFYELSGGSEFEPTEWRKSKAVSHPEIAETPSAMVQETQETSRFTYASPKLKATDLAVILASTPTTKRLAGHAVPTPTDQLVALGPQYDPNLVWERLFEPLEEEPALPVAEPDFRRVSADFVNLRTGPGTEFLVVGTLAQNTEVEVLEESGHGWVKLQELASGSTGWMSENLLQKIQF